MKIGDRIYVRGYIDEIRKDTVIVRNDGGYFGTIPSEVTGELPSAQPEIIRCNDCKWSDWYDSTDGNRYCYCMETGASGRTADDFCSYAERRTDERFNQQTGGDRCGRKRVASRWCIWLYGYKEHY